MKTNAREVAVNILTEVYEDKGYNNVVLRRTLDEHDELSKLDKAFITQIVNGTLKNSIFIDYIISKFVKMKIEKMDAEVLNIIRTAVYQLLFMDKVPESAICNEAVNISKSLCAKHLHGFINGVVRNIIRSKDKIEYPKANTIDYLSIIYSYPKWILEMWLKEYDYATVEQMCKSLNSDPEVSICVNTLKVSVNELENMLKEKEISVTKGNYIQSNLRLVGTSNIAELVEYKNGLFYVQDESSMIAIKCLNPVKGEKILDICSAPGGKSFYSALLMNNEGEIVSRDIYEHKIDMIEESAKRLGLKIIQAEMGNAELLDETLIGKFDKVVVDAPCSGFGILRKKPDIKLNRAIGDIDELVKLQRKILLNAVQYLKEDGILLYCTCTIGKSENQDNFQWMLDNLGLKADDISKYLPNELKSETARDGYIELLPHIHGMDGFFITRLRKC